MNILTKTTNLRIFRNTGWLVFEHVFKLLLSLVVTSIVARYLGAYNYGMLNYGLAYIAIFSNISSLGMDSMLVYEIVNKRENAGEFLGTAIVMRVTSSLLSIICLYIIATFIKLDRLVAIVTLIQSISIVFNSIDLLKYWFQSNLDSKYVVLSKLLAFILCSFWRIFLVILCVEVHYFAIATIIESVAIALALYISYIKRKGPNLKIKFSIAVALLGKSYHFILASLLVSIYTQIDKIMIGQIADITAVGIYTAGMRVSALWIFIPMAIIESLRPLIMQEKNVSEEMYLHIFGKLNTIIIWISIIAAIVLTFLSSLIVAMIYGPDFFEAAPVLIVLAWSRIFSLIGTVRSIWLISENLQMYVNVFVGIGAVANVLINFCLIPLWGALGAAIATLIAEIFASFATLFLINDTKPLAQIITKSFFYPLRYIK